jgi:hypothetical protein
MLGARGTIGLAGMAALFAAVALAAPASAAAGPGRKAMTDYRIAITGSPGTEFQAECRLRTGPDAQDEVPVEFKGVVPQRREFAGEALRCGIRQSSAAGSLTVELSSSRGNHTTSRTRGGGSTINLAIQ